MAKNPSANAGDLRDAGLSLGQEDPLEEEMPIMPIFFDRRIPQTEEPHGNQSIGSQGVGQD